MKKTIISVTDKDNLRKIYLQLLKKVSKNNNQKWSKIIAQKFCASHYFKQNQVFGLYNALSYEVATKDIIVALWSNAKVVCLPRINGENLDFYIVNSWDDIIIDNDLQIGQPRLTCQKVKPSDINCMIVPLIAVDEDYYRIGYGRGFYDRYLAQKNINFHKIGLAFKVQRMPLTIEHDSWDVPLDIIFYN